MTDKKERTKAGVTELSEGDMKKAVGGLNPGDAGYLVLGKRALNSIRFSDNDFNDADLTFRREN